MQTALTEVNGDADVFFADSSMGVVSKDNGSNSIGNYVEDQTDIGNSYTVYLIFLLTTECFL